MADRDLVLRLAKRMRPSGGERLPLRHGDTDISSADSAGQFYITIKDADLQQQELLIKAGQALVIRSDATAVQEERPFGGIRFLIDEKLMVSFRLPVVKEDGELDNFTLQDNWKDAAAAVDLVKEKCSYAIAQLVMAIVSEYYGLTPSSETGEVIDDAKNLPALLDETEESDPPQ